MENCFNVKSLNKSCLIEDVHILRGSCMTGGVDDATCETEKKQKSPILAVFIRLRDDSNIIWLMTFLTTFNRIVQWYGISNGGRPSRADSHLTSHIPEERIIPSKLVWIGLKSTHVLQFCVIWYWNGPLSLSYHHRILWNSAAALSIYIQLVLFRTSIYFARGRICANTK